MHASLSSDQSLPPQAFYEIWSCGCPILSLLCLPYLLLCFSEEGRSGKAKHAIPHGNTVIIHTYSALTEGDVLFSFIVIGLQKALDLGTECSKFILNHCQLLIVPLR